MTVRPERAQGLGRGLASLIPQRSGGQPITIEIQISRIRPNPHQPRKRFDPDGLAGLSASITEHGVLQPIVVTETIDGYQLVAGERRLRAAQLAGLDRMPAVVRQLADREQLEVALVENLQREDLDPLETADAYRQLIDEFGFTQDDLATRVGRARSTVANTLRLLDLAPGVAGGGRGRPVDRGARSGARGTARRAAGSRARLRPRAGAQRPADGGARATPARAQARSGGNAGEALDPDLERVEEDLRRSLGTKVSLARSRRGGRIVIEYYSDEELGRLYERLTGGTA